MGTEVALATGVGVLTAIAAAHLLLRAALERLSLSSTRLGLLRAVATLGGVVALLPAFFLAIIFGGNFGGSWGEQLFGSHGVSIGIRLGVATVFFVSIASAAYACAIVVHLFTRPAGRGGAF